MSTSPNRAREIFVAAVKLTPDRWDAYLMEACGDDETLRDRVRNLLSAHREAGSFLEPLTSPAVTTDEALSERPGTLIGPYKLLEPIGEGGFGAVFLAEQIEPVRRKVALKVLKPGMDSRQVVARFEAERQALALMDHPNIAKVFDGGSTPSGRPYFVMELVQGVPITDCCDQNQLTPRQRLELFAAVCQAVQHAHQKGIIHRDLKPSNILVSRRDATPAVKVIDFGIAKALGQELTDKTLFTGFAQVVGTPLYMSPEQASQSGLDVDTRADVYSLGVLLYELLTGTTPFTREWFQGAGYDEICRIIREEEPPRPSTRLSESKDTLSSISARRQTEPAKLTRLVRGELDWIVMKCLEKNRNRRYETASALAADVQRYLADEPVQACPPSAAYRLRKFFRRHKAPILAAGLMLLVLIGGISGTTLGLIQAMRAKSETDQTIVKVKQERDAKELARKEAADNATRADKEKKDAEQERELATFQALCAKDARHALQMVVVQRALERGDLKEADRVLGETDDAYHQTWEQRYLRSVCRPVTLPGSVIDAAFSRDGKSIITPTGVRDAATSQQKRPLKGILSPDGKWVAVIEGFVRPGQVVLRCEVVVRDAQTDEMKFSFPVSTEVRRLKYSPDGRWLAAACEDGIVRLWDPQSGQLKRSLEPGRPDVQRRREAPGRRRALRCH
jgi:serine/threonine protein kinase